MSFNQIFLKIILRQQFKTIKINLFSKNSLFYKYKIGAENSREISPKFFIFQYKRINIKCNL